jgi:hypothetical protein
LLLPASLLSPSPFASHLFLSILPLISSLFSHLSRAKLIASVGWGPLAGMRAALWTLFSLLVVTAVRASHPRMHT